MPATILSVRISEAERDLLDQASAEARTTISDFARRSLVEAAEATLMERRGVVLPASAWSDFEAWMARPADPPRALSDLMRRRPSWEA